ncbi:MAG: LacI family DNA-binding transcriptional regulator [Terrimicrobiaceae bacterium]
MPALPQARVTQKDVAREAGVSHVTVSLALRGRREIPLTTQKKIKAIAKRLGYSPDPMLGALSAYRRIQRPAAFHSNLAWINSDPKPEGFYIGDYNLYFEGARTRARELGYGLEKVHLADYNYDYRTVQRMLAARGINGLLIGPVPDYKTHIALDWSRYSAVRFGYSMLDTVLHTVTNSQYRTAFFAVEHLVRCGYRRIGYVTEKTFNIRTGGHFLGGFLSARAFFATEEIPVATHGPVVDNQWDRYWEPVLRWAKKVKPDAILAGGGDTFYFLERQGFRIPEDFGFAALTVDKSEKQFSGMHQNPWSIGVGAANLLVSLIERQETGIPETPMHVLFESRWIDGRTTAPLKKSANRAAFIPPAI